ncbi:hypothetical protein D9M69_654160 [compost metagenome]
MQFNALGGVRRDGQQAVLGLGVVIDIHIPRAIGLAGRGSAHPEIVDLDLANLVVLRPSRSGRAQAQRGNDSEFADVHGLFS